MVDWVLAAVLMIGELASAAAQEQSQLNALAIVSLSCSPAASVEAGDPVLATLIAITGLIAFQLASGYAGDGRSMLTVIALDFYCSGAFPGPQDAPGRIGGCVRLLASERPE